MSKCSFFIIYHQIYLQHHPEILEIPSGYVIHHKDFDHDNNDPNNLEMMTISEHMRLHCRISKIGNTNTKGKKMHTEKSKQMLSEALKGEKNGMYGKKRSQETIQKQIKSRTFTITEEMVNDCENKISTRDFCDKYKMSRSIKYKIVKMLRGDYDF